MSTIADFFSGSDEGNRSELDNAIAEEQARRARVEERERSMATTVYNGYKTGAIKKLNNRQAELLIKFGYAYVVETTETEYGKLVIK